MNDTDNYLTKEDIEFLKKINKTWIENEWTDYSKPFCESCLHQGLRFAEKRAVCAKDDINHLEDIHSEDLAMAGVHIHKLMDIIKRLENQIDTLNTNLDIQDGKFVIEI